MLSPSGRPVKCVVYTATPISLAKASASKPEAGAGPMAKMLVPLPDIITAGKPSSCLV